MYDVYVLVLHGGQAADSDPMPDEIALISKNSLRRSLLCQASLGGDAHLRKSRVLTTPIL